MKRNFNAKKTLKYAITFAAYSLLTLADDKYTPFALSLLCANVGLGLNPVVCLLLFVLPFAASLDPTAVAIAAIGGVIAVSGQTLLRKHGLSKGPLTAIVAALSALPFVFLSESDIYAKLVVTAIIAAATFPMRSAATAWLIKGLKYRLSNDERISASILFCAAGYGFVTVFGELPWQAIGIFVTLTCATVLGGLTPLLIALAFAFPPSLVYFSFTPFAVYSLIALAAIIFSDYSKLLTAVTAAAVQAALWFFTSAYEGLTPYHAVYAIVPVTVYLFLPTSWLKTLRDRLKIVRNANLSKYSVNRNRAALSGKLFDVSEIFAEMSASMKKLDETSKTDEDLKSKISDEILFSVCSTCPNSRKCRASGIPDETALSKTITLGTAKGSLNLVDLPRSFSEDCTFPESVVVKLNELLKEYERGKNEAEALRNGRALVVDQTRGLAEILKSLAVKTGRKLNERGDVEKKLLDNLFECGIYAFEVLVFGEGTDAEINLTVPPAALNDRYFLRAISESVGYPVAITSRTNLSDSLSAVTLAAAPKMDAAFGVAQRTKADKPKSGDTHSITKLSEGKFLVALNDGMGSGKHAEDASATAISLVETFYKSGLSSELILSTVNKALAFNREDDFTAMDIGVVDLFNGSADFIKIGTPYSFVITRDSVKIIEGSSLPLGILDEMKPTVCNAKLYPGDTILFVSDGISDAFGSATDLIDFLTTEKAVNPKALADNVMNKALSLTDGIARDDMTAFCIRLFEKAS